MRYLMGIDNGGTFVKAALFDENGVQIAKASVPVVTLTPRPGYAERDMDELWRVNAQAVRRAVEKSGIAPQQIAGVSLSGHGKGLYLVDGQGRPTAPGILSTDMRAWAYPKHWKEDGTAERIYPKTAQTILACQPVSLLAWLRDERPEVLERTRYVFAVKDYIRYRLTGEAYGEYTDFSGGNLVNLGTGDYDQELLSCFGLGELYEKLPPLRRSCDCCGTVTREASLLTGLLEGIPVAAGMFDVDACGIASGLVSEAELCMVAGTWSINEYIRRAPVTNGTVDLNSMFCMDGYYLVEESSPTSAGNLEWFLRTLLPREQEEARRAGGSIYGQVNDWVASVLPEECQLIFLPFLNGSNEDPLAKGTFVGLTGFHDRRHMLRAVYEGVVFSHLTHVNKLLRNRSRPASVRLAGGAANSPVWVQIFADALQIPVDSIEDKELGAQGAAMAAGVAAGVYRDYADAAARTVRLTGTVQPRAEYARHYQEKYSVYRDVVDRLNGLWERFAD